MDSNSRREGFEVNSDSWLFRLFITRTKNANMLLYIRLHENVPQVSLLIVSRGEN